MADALPQLKLRLPGQWWQVPLHDAARARDSVKRLVERMHGRIDVKSTLGEGTEFTVHLTFPKASKQAHAEPQPKAPQLVLKGTTILLCEDNEMNREIATAILEKSGARVVSAVNGKEGTERFYDPGTTKLTRF